MFKYLKSAAVFSLSIFVLTANAEEYKIDPDHTSITFEIDHLVISSVVGGFKDFSGDFTYDKDDVSKSNVNVFIKADSIDTYKEKRDEHLRSADFFNVSQFPEITFKSKKIVPQDNSKEFAIVGDLTIHGVTKEVKLETKYKGETKDQMGNQKIAFEAETEINRKDFGLTWNKILEAGGVAVGDKVDIEIKLQGIKK